MTLKDMIPKNNTSMPDRIFETWWCLSNVCGGLGNLEVVYGRSSDDIDRKISAIAGRANTVMHLLLEESGRAAEFDEWKKNNP